MAFSPSVSLAPFSWSSLLPTPTVNIVSDSEIPNLVSGLMLAWICCLGEVFLPELSRALAVNFPLGYLELVCFPVWSLDMVFYTASWTASNSAWLL